MKIGLIGYKGSGKSTLFQWLTGETPDASLSHSTQEATAAIPEHRVAGLCEIYNPKKVTMASMTIVDTPGLSRDQDGNPTRLAKLREAADCVVCLIPSFEGSEPAKEINALQEDLILADLEIVTNRIQRINEQKRKPLVKSEADKQEFELETLEMIREELEAGKMPVPASLTPEQLTVVRAFRLFLEKPRMIVVNTGDEELHHARFNSLATAEVPLVAVSIGLETELEKMDEEERKGFLEELGVPSTDRDQLLKMILDASGQMVFLTAGDKEVRTWLVTKNATAVEAAGAIHTDMAKGFIRAEVMRCEDLMRLGSEREVKAANLNRREPKDYIVKEGDVLLFHFSGR